jgi:hypothetical protein
MRSSLQVCQFPWSPKSQREVATSTTLAQYIGTYNAILHLQWLRTFLAETQLYRSHVTSIMADNQPASYESTPVRLQINLCDIQMM